MGLQRREANAAHEVLKARIRANPIKYGIRVEVDHYIGALLIPFLKPLQSTRFITKSHTRPRDKDRVCVA